MASLWFLKLSLKCIDHLAWPLLALGYPLCASVQAIETDSNTETRNLISYWILFSLIYLFEYAFMRLLQWFQFWPYMKLMVIFWLIVPDFGRSSYVYNHLVHPFISMKPQVVESRLKNWKKLFIKKQNFLQHAERYIEENGTKALEELITSKGASPFLLPKNTNTTHNPNTEATNALRPKDTKETQQYEHHHMHTNEKRHQTEHKDVKDLEVIEKKEIPAGKRDIPIVPNLASSQNASSAMAGNDIACGELPHSSTNKEVQKEWTCAICQVTTSSEITLNSHLHGRKHKNNCEALEAKNKLVKKKQKVFEELKPMNILHANIEQKNIQISHAKERAQTSKETEKSMINDAAKHRTNNSQANKKTCVISVHASTNKTDQLNAKIENGKSAVNNELKGKVATDHKKVQMSQNNLCKPVSMNPSKFRCDVCNVKCTSAGDMASHLNGRKHLSQIQS